MWGPVRGRREGGRREEKEEGLLWMKSPGEVFEQK